MERIEDLLCDLWLLYRWIIGAEPRNFHQRGPP